MSALLVPGSLLELSRVTLSALPPTPTNFGLAGAVGDALFASVLSRLDSGIDSEYWTLRAVGYFNANGAGASLHNGVAGLGFVLAKYADVHGIDDLDLGLLARVREVPVASLQSGVPGIALYAALSQGNRAASGGLQGASVQVLASAAARRGEGVLWHTPGT